MLTYNRSKQCDNSNFVGLYTILLYVLELWIQYFHVNKLQWVHHDLKHFQTIRHFYFYQFQLNLWVIYAIPQLLLWDLSSNKNFLHLLSLHFRVYQNQYVLANVLQKIGKQIEINSYFRAINLWNKALWKFELISLYQTFSIQKNNILMKLWIFKR